MTVKPVLGQLATMFFNCESNVSGREESIIHICDTEINCMYTITACAYI